MGLRKKASLANRINHISKNMTTIGKMVIGDENIRNRESHGQHRHSTPTMHTPRPSVLRSQSSNSISFFLL